jgi:hypothetical protein
MPEETDKAGTTISCSWKGKILINQAKYTQKKEKNFGFMIVTDQ